MAAMFLLCSNPVVQVNAVESGALQTLLTMLATAHPLSVKKKVLTHAHVIMCQREDKI